MDKDIFLNCGAGNDYKKGWTNLDLLPGPESDQQVDLVNDLEDASLPFDNDSVSFINADHVLEHIENYVELMKEFHRVLKPNGLLHICVPEFPCAAAIADPTHKRYFVPTSFSYLTVHNMGFDTSRLQGAWKMLWLESIANDRGALDRGKTGSYFTEIECELAAIKN